MPKPIKTDYPDDSEFDGDLAAQIANGLDESEELPMFRVLVKRYPETFLRRAYQEARSVPPEKIRKSKAALFLYLVKKYARQQHTSQPNPDWPPEDPRD